MKRAFWVRPPLWVLVLFCFSMALSATAYVTTREGLRFVSRKLQPTERRVVLTALQAWDELTDGQSASTTRKLRVMLQENRLRSMHGLSFARPRERSTFGYTDERDRILLNPRLCFGSMVWRDKKRVHDYDLVVTLSTLVHEDQHYSRNAGEREAYRVEWLFLRQALKVARQRGLSYSESLALWEEQTALRIGETLGEEQARRLAEELNLTANRP